MTNPSENPIRVAVLADSPYLERWRRNALAVLTSTAPVEITHVVTSRETGGAERRKRVTGLASAFEQVRTYPLWSLVGVARLLRGVPWYHQPVHIDSVDGLGNARWLACRPRPVDDHWNELPEETVTALADTDVAIRFGFGMLTGAVLDAPTHGILSYHPGDIRKYRGMPGGFWEFLHDEDEMGVTVQRLTDTLDGGQIAAFESVDIGDADTWHEVKEAMYLAAEGLLVPAVAAVTDPDRTLETPAELGDLYTCPRGRAVIEYVLKTARGKLRGYRRGRDANPPRATDRV